VVGKSCENDTDIIYCGRRMSLGGWKLDESIGLIHLKSKSMEVMRKLVKSMKSI
jgi:hypothetical protein